jgi:HPr kinase/phosphorylase
MSRTVTLHGVLLEVEGLGVLLTGASGAGKSASALELIQRGARLVADDAPEFHLDADGNPEGRCPALLRDFIEVQGLGLLDMRALYGTGALRERVTLDLVIKLARRRGPVTRALHGPDYQTQDVLGATVPRLTLHLAPGYSAAPWIEALVRNHKLRLSGHQAQREFLERHARALRRA